MGSPLSSRSGQTLRRLLFKDVWIVYEVREGDDEASSYVLVLTVRRVREKPEDPE